MGFRICLVVVALFVAAASYAVAPNNLSYQGRLTDAGGVAVPNGIRSVEFRVWDEPVGGNMLWASGSVSVTTSDGIFSVTLGSSPQAQFPADLFSDTSRYLGVTIALDPEISPRTRLNASPYTLGIHEPGIASNYEFSSGPNYARTEFSSTDILSVTITLPVPGYVVVDGYATLYILGDGTTFAWLQISESSGAAGYEPSFTWVNSQGYANAESGAYCYQSIPLKRIFYKNPGTYTFYMQGNAYSLNSSNTAVTDFGAQWLTAVFYPVSYGPVTAPVPSLAGFDGVKSRLVPMHPDMSGERAVHTVDLQQLELRAAETAGIAAEAQRLLDQARRESAAGKTPDSGK